MNGDGRDGSWDEPSDDIGFEEFQLREPENWEDVDPYRPVGSAGSYHSCPSCGVMQSSSNRHCDECGARLGRQQVAVAAPPLRSVSPGGRALAIIVVGIALVVVAAIVIRAIRGDDVPPEATTSLVDTTPSTPPTTMSRIMQVTPISIVCSSEYNANLGCENLIDGADTYWNDESLRGEDAWIKVTFVNPVALESVLFINVSDEEKFRRNYRVRAVEIEADDLPGIPFVEQIPNANDRPLSVPTPTNHTTELDIRITATYVSEPVGGDQAFDELAIQELEFWGRVVETVDPVEGTDISG